MYIDESNSAISIDRAFSLRIQSFRKTNDTNICVFYPGKTRVYVTFKPDLLWRLARFVPDSIERDFHHVDVKSCSSKLLFPRPAVDPSCSS